MNPLTHHEILALVAPFSERGRQVDLTRTDRTDRRLAFKSLEPAAGSDLREELVLENPERERYRLRLLALVTASVLLFNILPPEELGEALLSAGLSPRLVFLLEGSLRFAPTMATLLREVREAQESRGIRLDGFYLLRNGAALLVPLLIDVMRFADDLAEALEARGFGGQQRTPLIEYRFQWYDWALVTTAALLTGTLVRAFLLA